MKVEFTEYVLPNAERRKLEIDVDDRFGPAVAEILARGRTFEAEILRTNMISLTIADRSEDHDVEIVLIRDWQPATLPQQLTEATETMIKRQMPGLA